MSGDDSQPSKNPFVRFKNHVDSRIGSGISLVTGKSTTGNSATETSSIPAGAANTMDPAIHFGHRSPTMHYWKEWSYDSLYSPWNLRHLRQPTPNGLPTGTDPALFGFQDALEDLLAASAGRSLMDLNKQAGYKRDLIDTFGYSEPPVLWIDRMSRNGLLPTPLLPSHKFRCGTVDDGHQNHHHGPDSMQQWLEERRQQKTSESTDAWQPLENGKEEELRRQEETIMRKFKQLEPNLKELVESTGGNWDDLKKFASNLGSFGDFGSLRVEMARRADQEAREWEKLFDKRFTESVSGNDHTKTLEEARGRSFTNAQEEQPATEGDLFDFVWSTVAEADRSFSNFTKAIMETSNKIDKEANTSCPAISSTSTRMEPKEGEIVQYNESGGKTIVSNSEHVDIFGFVHQKTEVRKLDADGKEISRETQYHIRSAPQIEKQAPKEVEGFQPPNYNSQSEEESASSSGRKPSGWFWR